MPVAPDLLLLTALMQAPPGSFITLRPTVPIPLVLDDDWRSRPRRRRRNTAPLAERLVRTAGRAKDRTHPWEMYPAVHPRRAVPA